ncbi:nose resistant to fluoxetine protein 6-like [Anastrepha obliqua]|uniref:nose resistant to fluoxetine protein 6-like n=1 Tax=Anastrepha obliqua TaxID=95512 RepID=UPI0024099B19|nr:nose resistant to fluoxetine protein 6-like [Anastrepha obliqua]
MWKFSWVLLILTTLLPRSNASLRDNVQKVNENHLSLDTILDYSTILFPLTTVSSTNLVSKQCDLNMQKLRRGILAREAWALKALDASGSKPPAFIFGDNFWLGNQELCEAARNGLNLDISRYIKHKMNVSLLAARSPLDVDYRVVFLDHDSPYQVDAVFGQYQPVLHIGLCVPQVCSTQEVMQLFNAYLESDLFVDNDLYELKPRVLHAKAIKLEGARYYKLIPFQLLAGFVICTLLLTFCAFRLRSRQTKMKNMIQKGENLQNSNENATASQTSLEAFIQCYDLQLNWSKIATVPDSSANQLSFLNGARIVSVLVSIYFHAFVLMHDLASNAAPLFAYTNNIGNVDVAMDVFLFLSGFLQAYSVLHKKKQIERIRQSSFIQNIKEIVKIVSRRYLRLAPLYYVMICASYLTLQYLDNTRGFYLTGVMAEKCEHYWWRNVLFIHNLFEHREMCLVWTWYLSCEMQYSIVLTILLTIHAKKPRFTKMSVLMIIIGSLIYQTIMSIHLNYQISLETTFTHFKTVYMHPLSRIFPYLTGATASWLLLEYNSQLRSTKLLNNFSSHLISLVFSICARPAPFGRVHTVRMATFILILQRCGYSLGFCGMLLAMANKRLSWYCRILNANIFQKATHFAYALSMLNSLLLIFVYIYGGKLAYQGALGVNVLYIGLVVVVYVLSVPVTLFFEIPYRNISSLLTKRGLEKTS